MTRLLRSGVYRLVHGRKLWVGTALIVAACFGVVTLMSLMVGTLQADGSAGVGGLQVTVDGGRYSSVAPDSADAAVLDIFSSRTAPNHSCLLVLMGLFQGGTAGMLVSVVAVLVHAEDFERGFVRAELAGGHDRVAYHASYLALAALLAVWYSLVVVASTEAAFAAAGVRVVGAEPLWRYGRLVGLNTLGVVAVTLTVAAVHSVVRSKVAGVSLAICIGGGAMGSVLTGLAQLLGERFGWIAQAVSWLPTVNLGRINDAAPLLGLTSSASQGAAALPDAGMSAWTHALVCFIGWIAAAVAVTLLANRRRDVC